MDSSEYLVSTPWDTQVFGINTFEIIPSSEEVLEQVIPQIVVAKESRHYTVKVEPLACKKLLHNYGFYYCDTLLEPYCTPERLIHYQREGITLSLPTDIEQLIKICHGAFTHGRFHRDFNLDKELANIRYVSWLKQLYETNSVFSLMEHGNIAGFIGFSNSNLVLHALSENYRGKGIAKYFWSLACQNLFNAGHLEIASSISASNVAVLNLYASLGFKFRNPLDVYHLLTNNNKF